MTRFDRDWSTAIELVTRCETCHHILPINGPWREVTCAGCARVQALDAELWHKLLHAPTINGRVMREGETSEMSIGFGPDALKIKVTKMVPPCPGCDGELNAAQAMRSNWDTIDCPHCRAALAGFPAPDTLRRAEPDLAAVIGAPRSTDATSSEVVRWYLYFSIREATNRDARRRAADAVGRLRAGLRAKGLEAPPWPDHLSVPEPSMAAPTDSEDGALLAIEPLSELTVDDVPTLRDPVTPRAPVRIVSIPTETATPSGGVSRLAVAGLVLLAFALGLFLGARLL